MIPGGGWMVTVILNQDLVGLDVEIASTPVVAFDDQGEPLIVSNGRAVRLDSLDEREVKYAFLWHPDQASNRPTADPFESKRSVTSVNSVRAAHRRAKRVWRTNKKGWWPNS